MPTRPDGKAARVERVTFTRPAADRIARAVRNVEAGDRQSSGVAWGPRLEGGPAGKIFRICTFTGAWSISSAKTVTFFNQTVTPNTASATNLFASITAASGSRYCAIAREGSKWYLIAAQC